MAAVRGTVVVGGGLVGSAVACAVGAANGGVGCGRLALLDHAARAIPVPKLEGFSNRVTALTPKSVNFLESIGVWGKVAAQRAHPVTAMQVWDAASEGCVWLDAADAGADTVCIMVENDVLQHAMNLRMDELPSIEVMRGVSVTGIEHRRRSDIADTDGSGGDDAEAEFAARSPSAESSCVAVTVDGDVGEVLGRLVVGADGPNSVVKRAGGFASVGWRYDQAAVVGTVEVSAGGDNTVAWQRFLPTGPVALLPMSDTVSSVVWSTTPERARELVQMDPKAFTAELNDAFNSPTEEHNRAGAVGGSVAGLLKEVHRLGERAAVALGAAGADDDAALGGRRLDPPFALSVADGSRASFPLSLGHANQYVRPRLALAGDSAHKVHPLAGQGLNLGLGDAEELAATVSRAHAAGLDLGDVNGLLEYERQRQRAVVPVMAATDFFKRVFSTANPAVAGLRGVGVLAVDRIAPLKAAIMRSAMGVQ